MSEVCIFLADGFEEVEALTPVDLLRRADIKVTTVATGSSLYVKGSHNITVAADILFEDKDFESTDMLILPGGMPGTTNLKAHEGLARLILDFNAKGKKLGAICAAPTVLGSLNLLDGRKAVCYPGCEGGLGKAEIPENVTFVTDGNITTSRGAGTAMDFALELIRVLEGEDAAKNIKDSVIYIY